LGSELGSLIAIGAITFAIFTVIKHITYYLDQEAFIRNEIGPSIVALAHLLQKEKRRKEADVSRQDNSRFIPEPRAITENSWLLDQKSGSLSKKGGGRIYGPSEWKWVRGDRSGVTINVDGKYLWIEESEITINQ
jgi:hypothetical protein